MGIEFHAPRCRDCDERERWERKGDVWCSSCVWCETYGNPEEQN